MNPIEKLKQMVRGESPQACNSADKSSGCGCQGEKVDKKMNRRQALGAMSKSVTMGAAIAQSACSVSSDSDSFEESVLNWQEYFKKNYRLMNDQEKQDTVKRLERLHQIKHESENSIKIDHQKPIPGVLYGYAFNISKCKGYMDCVEACIKENNQDRESNMQYIRMFEMEKGKISLDHADGLYEKEVPTAGSFFMGTQCFQCENPPCVDVCPVGATWKEDDGIVVIDYDWCIGCRYCEAACPYWARRFNWSEPKVPEDQLNNEQHYLGNRKRGKGVMEKCTFCLQKSRKGKNPACVEACPTGARVFGNLLDPNSEIRWVIENKKVFRLKEELGTEPKFWYYMD